MSPGDAIHEWPPTDALAFVESPAFGELVLEAAVALTEREPRTDFTESVARTFVWFDGQATRDRTFIATKFPSLASLRAYLRKTILNEFRRSMRESRRERARDSAVLATFPNQSPDAPIEQSSIQRAFEQLSPNEREIVKKMAIEGLTATETARQLGIHRRTISRTYQRALDRLQQLLDD